MLELGARHGPEQKNAVQRRTRPPGPAVLPSGCQQPMEAKMAETVKSLPATFVAEDLSVVELEFEFESEARQKLRFPMQLFEQFMGRAAQLVAVARSRTLAIGDRLEIHAVQVRDATAQAPVGGGKVFLLLVGDNGMPMNFGLSPAHADRLRREIFHASRDARKQASKPRH